MDTVQLARLESKRAPPARFLFSDCLRRGEPQLDTRTFLVHTQSPRFLCELVEDDDLSARIEEPLVGAWVQTGERAVWNCTDFAAFQWQFWETRPTDAELHALMLHAAEAFRIFQQENQTAYEALQELKMALGARGGRIVN